MIFTLTVPCSMAQIHGVFISTVLLLMGNNSVGSSLYCLWVHRNLTRQQLQKGQVIRGTRLFICQPVVSVRLAVIPLNGNYILIPYICNYIYIHIYFWKLQW